MQLLTVGPNSFSSDKFCSLYCRKHWSFSNAISIFWPWIYGHGQTSKANAKAKATVPRPRPRPRT